MARRKDKPRQYYDVIHITFLHAPALSLPEDLKPDWIIQLRRHRGSTGRFSFRILKAGSASVRATDYTRLIAVYEARLSTPLSSFVLPFEMCPNHTVQDLADYEMEVYKRVCHALLQTTNDTGRTLLVELSYRIGRLDLNSREAARVEYRELETRAAHMGDDHPKAREVAARLNTLKAQLEGRHFRFYCGRRRFACIPQLATAGPLPSA